MCFFFPNTFFFLFVPFDANTRWKPFLLTLSLTYLAVVVALSVSGCPFARKVDFSNSRSKLAKPGKPRGSGKNSCVPSRRRGYFSFVNEIKTIVGCTWLNPYKQADPCL